MSRFWNSTALGTGVLRAFAFGLGLMASNFAYAKQYISAPSPTANIIRKTSADDLTIHNVNDIWTDARHLTGIFAASNGGSIQLTNNGSVVTKGDIASAIRLWTFDDGLDASNNGFVSTEGDYSSGLEIASGNSDASNGRLAQRGGDITIVNSGSLETLGDWARGINVWSNGGAVDINNSGVITTKGEDADGILISSGEDGFDGRLEQVGGSVGLLNSAIISTNGSSAEAIKAWSHGGDVTIENLGSLTTKGDVAHVIDVSSGNSGENDRFVKAGGTILVKNSSMISTKGNASFGISGWSNGGDVQVANEGLILTQGEGASGVRLASGSLENNNGSSAMAGGNLSFANHGKITTHGDQAAAVSLWTNGGNVSVENTGTISTHGKGSNAIETYSSDVSSLDYEQGSVPISTLLNRGLLEAENGLAITSYGFVDDVTNVGTIQGGAFFGDKDDVLTNAGTLIGNFDFGTGDDQLKLALPNSNIDAATFEGGTGMDSVDLLGGGTIDGERFGSFERVNLHSGNFQGNGLNVFSDQVTLSFDATLSQIGTASNLYSDGTINIAAEEVVHVTGDLTVNGNLNIEVENVDRHGFISVGGTALFASTSLSYITAAPLAEINDGDAFAIVSANDIVIEEILDGETFEIASNFASTAFTASVVDVDGLQVINILSVVQDLEKLLPLVDDEYSAELEKVIEFIKPREGDEEFTQEQEKIAAFIDEHLDLVEIQNGEISEKEKSKLNSFVEELTNDHQNQAKSSTLNAGVRTSTNMLQARLDGRVRGGGLQIGESNRLGYAPENKKVGAIRHITAMADEGNEGSQPFSQTGEAWVQMFHGRLSETRPTANVKGSNWGGAAGIDYLLDNDSVAGTAFVFTDSTSSAAGTVESSSTNTQTFGLTAYAGNSDSNSLGFSGSLGYYRSRHDGTRNGAGGFVYSSDYGSNTFVARGDVSKVHDAGGYSLTPHASLTYSRTAYDGYVETSTGGAPKTMNAFTTSSLVGALGVSVSSQKVINGLQVTPEFHARGLYEFNDVMGSYTGSLAGISGSNFSADVTASDRLKINVGGSIQIEHTSQLTSEFMYDGIFASDSEEHMLKYKGSYKF